MEQGGLDEHVNGQSVNQGDLKGTCLSGPRFPPAMNPAMRADVPSFLATLAVPGKEKSGIRKRHWREEGSPRKGKRREREEKNYNQRREF